MRPHPSRPLPGLAGLLVAAVVGSVVVAIPQPSAAAPLPVAISVTGANGTGRSTQPGLACNAGGDGAAWHYGYEAELPAGTFTGLPTSLRLNLDVHGELVGFSSGGPGGPADNGFLQGSESTVALVNERGTVVLRLSDGGSCSARTALVTGESATTNGSWEVDSGTGAFESATGVGTFDVTAGIAPGADNPFDLDLAGAIDVAAPDLQVTVATTWWGNLGIDFLLRQPTVVYRITNAGDGDAFAAQLNSAAPSSPGAYAIAGTPAALGDLAPGESAYIAVRYRLDLLGPCTLIVLGCRFNVAVHTSMVDGLDRPLTDVDGLLVETPLLAPGL